MDGFSKGENGDRGGKTIAISCDVGATRYF